jgi:hypothetical protein
MVGCAAIMPPSLANSCRTTEAFGRRFKMVFQDHKHADGPAATAIPIIGTTTRTKNEHRS